MKKRRFLTAAFTGVILAVPAAASSILELEAMDEAPSLTKLEPAEADAVAPDIAPGAEPVPLSPSIIAIGVPAVGIENTAAVDGGEHRDHFRTGPLVIRGGLTSDPFARVAPAQPSGPSQQANARRSVPEPVRRPE